MSGSVIVVGGGPAGACLAWLLASRGAEVTLVERQRDFAREFRGEILLPTGQEALEDMGLAGLFAEVPQSVPATFEIFNNARQLLRRDIDPDFFAGRPPVAFSQPIFLQKLIHRCTELPSFTAEVGTAAVGLVRDAGRVCGVRVKGPEGERELRADLVLGTDGRASAVRRHGDFEVSSQGVDVDVVWFKTPLPDFFGTRGGVRVYVGRAHLLICYASWDGQLQVAWVITKGTYGELRERGLEQWVDEIEGHVTPDLGRHLRQHRSALSGTFLLSAASDRVTSWSAPGVLLLGDAAHTMSPVGGQGINIALRDAIVAANLLVPVLRQGANPDAVDAASRAVERQRMGEVESIQRLQAVPPRVLMGHSWWSATARRLLPLLLRTPMGRARVQTQLRTLLFGIGEVHLEV